MINFGKIKIEPASQFCLIVIIVLLSIQCQTADKPSAEADGNSQVELTEEKKQAIGYTLPENRSFLSDIVITGTTTAKSHGYCILHGKWICRIDNM